MPRKKTYGETVNGELITEEFIERAVKRAEAGYAVDELKRRLLRLQMLMHEAHDRGALADGDSAALDRAGADVAGGVDAGDGGFQEAFGADVGAGEDEALLVAGGR